MPNLELTKKRNLSSFRRIAIGTWRTVKDPTVYGSVTLRMDEALRYMEEFRRVKQKRVTVTHLMAKAVAAIFDQVPEANAILRFNRIYERKTISLFFQIAMEDPVTGEIDLSGTTVYNPEQKTLEEIVDEFASRVKQVRSGKDKELEKTRGTFKKIPFFLLNTVLDLIGFLGFTLNLDMRWAGIPKDPMGSAMITNIGSLGLEEAYVPLVPYSRVPLLMATGAINDSPVVDNGEIKIAKTMRVFATFDHRILDGSHAAAMIKILKAWMEDPFNHFDSLDSPDPEDSR